VLDLRDTTQAKYRTIVQEHLRPRFGARRLDAIVADDLARLVREMRTEGKSDAIIAVVLSVVGQIYKFAARRLEWKGTIPTTLMLRSERPKISLAKRRPIFTGEQLEQTIAVAHGPFRTPFTVAALTGAPDLRAVRADLGQRPCRRPRGGRDRVRVAGGPSRQPPADKDGRLGENGAYPAGVGDHPDATQRRRRGDRG
jgi:hypothetical protein